MQIQLAGCIILNEHNKILLLHRNTPDFTQWELPGGKIEPDEEAADTAARELLEELGIVVHIEKLVGTTQFTATGKNYVYTWFLAVVTKGVPTICEPETFDRLAYFGFEELKTIELSGNMKKFLVYLNDHKLIFEDLYSG